MDRKRAKTAIEGLAKLDKLAFTEHAKVRDPKSGKFPLTREQVKNCLLFGLITEGPAPDIRLEGGWKVTVTRLNPSEKHEVAAVLVIDRHVVVITGYGWGERKRPARRPPIKDEEESDDRD